MHPKLRGSPIDLSKFGGLALQRSGHASPVVAAIAHDGIEDSGEIEWMSQDAAALATLDSRRVTEDGAEAVALAYTHVKSGWTVKRRLNQRESADWLLQNESGWLALEVSGTEEGDPLGRLREKKKQVARCSLTNVNRLAIVVAFNGPSIVAGSP
jgi:hypothetical protein